MPEGMTTAVGELRPYMVTVTMSVRLHATDPETAAHTAHQGIAIGTLTPVQTTRVDDVENGTTSVYVLTDETTDTHQEGHQP